MKKQILTTKKGRFIVQLDVSILGETLFFAKNGELIKAKDLLLKKRQLKKFKSKKKAKKAIKKMKEKMWEILISTYQK